MTQFRTFSHRLPLALAALGAASPALAHEAGFFHTHGESVVAALALAAAAGLGIRFIRARKSRK
ncbi:MAG: hypothetical protein AAGK17_13110 [Pseudomonadota bacterium]